MTARVFSVWVGDDDSGPEDIADDEDLECETVKMITFRYVPE
jgi:hypothetical protein